MAKGEYMSRQERIFKVVNRAVDSLNKQLPIGTPLLNKSLDERLFGKLGKLESLDFVTLIMDVESKIKEEFGIEIILTDEEMLSKEKSPFITIGNLIEYLDRIIENPENKVEEQMFP